MIESIGIIGSILLAVCGLPLAWEALWEKSIDINMRFLYTWTLGELLTLVYVWGDWILMLNYGFNLLCLIPVWYYRKR